MRVFEAIKSLPGKANELFRIIDKAAWSASVIFLLLTLCALDSPDNYKTNLYCNFGRLMVCMTALFCYSRVHISLGPGINISLIRRNQYNFMLTMLCSSFAMALFWPGNIAIYSHYDYSFSNMSTISDLFYSILFAPGLMICAILLGYDLVYSSLSSKFKPGNTSNSDEIIQLEINGNPLLLILSILFRLIFFIFKAGFLTLVVNFLYLYFSFCLKTASVDFRCLSMDGVPVSLKTSTPTISEKELRELIIILRSHFGKIESMSLDRFIRSGIESGFTVKLADRQLGEEFLIKRHSLVFNRTKVISKNCLPKETKGLERISLGDWYFFPAFIIEEKFRLLNINGESLELSQSGAVLNDQILLAFLKALQRGRIEETPAFFSGYPKLREISSIYYDNIAGTISVSGSQKIFRFRIIKTDAFAFEKVSREPSI